MEETQHAVLIYSWRHLASLDHRLNFPEKLNIQWPTAGMAGYSCLKVCMLWFKHDQFSRKEDSVATDQVQKAMQNSSTNRVKREIAWVFLDKPLGNRSTRSTNYVELDTCNTGAGTNTRNVKERYFRERKDVFNIDSLYM